MIQPEKCGNCKLRVTHSKGLCYRCYRYQVVQGKPRPKRVYSRCENTGCSRPIQARDRYSGNLVCLPCMIKTGTEIAKEAALNAT